MLHHRPAQIGLKLALQLSAAKSGQKRELFQRQWIRDMILHQTKRAKDTGVMTGLFHTDAALCSFRGADLRVDKATADTIRQFLAVPRPD